MGELMYDMHEFKQEEISLNIKNNMLELAAHHSDKGYRANTMMDMGRTFRLPEGVIKEKIEVNFSPKGMLTIRAPILQKRIEYQPENNKKKKKKKKKKYSALI